MMDKFIEGTISAIVLFWVITHASEFNTVTSAASQASIGGVRALWGR